MKSAVMLSVVAARGAALALSLAGQSRAAAAINAVADAAESGVAVDDHMAEVAARLKSGEPLTDADWDAVEAKIKAAAADVQGSATGS